MSASWTPAELVALWAHLAGAGAAALGAVRDAELLQAWSATVEAFLDPRSPERMALREPLARLTGLSPQGLEAALTAVLGGVREPHAAATFARAGSRRQQVPALVVLAGNLPALAVQPLLPALALRRPLLLKPSRDEPLFTAAFVAALARRLPALGDGLAVATWPGGDAALEAPLLAAAPTVIAYGGAETVADLARRASGRVVDHGPKLSLAVVAAGVDLPRTAAGLARDVALFDQRGCLSVQVVLVEGDTVARALAGELAEALRALAAELPHGPVEPTVAAAVQQLRAEAAMRGLWVADLPLAAGTVVVESRSGVRPSPGLRTVRVYPVPALPEAPGLLAPWRDRLQGAALAGDAAWALAAELGALGVTRCTVPGELQAADAAWHNGGRDPLEVLALR
jgi:hypothetical protein